jgi:hypothetical protein
VIAPFPRSQHLQVKITVLLSTSSPELLGHFNEGWHKSFFLSKKEMKRNPLP